MSGLFLMENGKHFALAGTRPPGLPHPSLLSIVVELSHLLPMKFVRWLFSYLVSFPKNIFKIYVYVE